MAEEIEPAYILGVDDYKSKAYPYSESCTTKVVTEDGRTAFRVIPNNKKSDGEAVIVDFTGLCIPADALKDVKWMTVDYKYECPEDTRNAESLMKFLGIKTAGLSEWVMVNSATKIKEAGWDSIKIKLSNGEFSRRLKSGELFQQFHLYPFGATASPKNFVEGEMMYLGDIKFYKEEPTIPETDAKEGSQRGEAVNEAVKAKTLIKEGVNSLREPLFTISMDAMAPKNKSQAVLLERVEENGKTLVKVSADTASATTKMIIDCNLAIPVRDLQKVRYIAFNYKYECPENIISADTNSYLIMIPYSGALKGWVTKGANTTTKVGEWDKSIYEVKQLEGLVDLSSPLVNFTQWHFYPFGNTVTAGEFSQSEHMYLGDVEFWAEYPDKVPEYNAAFNCKIGQAEGKTPAMITREPGQEYTLPENPYTLNGGTFLGWTSSTDDKLYQPGDIIKMESKNVTYTATFDYNDIGIVPFIALNYADYTYGTMNYDKTCSLEWTTFDDKNVLKVIPEASYDGKTADIVLDGNTYHTAGIDLSKYQYMAVTYYIDGELPEKEDGHFMSVGFSNIGGVLSKYSMAFSEPVKTGSWQVAAFDLSKEVANNLVPTMDIHKFRQMHLRPLHGEHSSALSGVNAIYINQIMFFKGSEVDLRMNEAYMQGYGDGLFKPGATMTRAEACTIVARLAAGGENLVPTDIASRFSDVEAGKWYTKYITYVDSLGYLGAYSGNFLPNQNITRAEFVELVYNMGLLTDKGGNGTFTDVDASHPRASLISAAGKAGLINGYANGDGTFSFKPDATITRAEVVKVVNNAYGRSVKKENLSENVVFLYYDVPETSWAYPEIAAAVLPHISSGGAWVCTMSDPKKLLGDDSRVDLKAGADKVAEIDALTEKRVDEIRNSESIDISNRTGKTYYVSNSTGNDANDGLSPATAWQTLTKVTRSQGNLIKEGDTVLFKRGDMWRDQAINATVNNVAYSAYGEGEKPLFSLSPEDGADPAKWTLYDAEHNIWQYATKMIDVGCVTFNYKSDNPSWGYKECPDLLDGVFYVRGTNQSKKFDMVESFDKDLDYFCDLPTYDYQHQTGYLYLRCDSGNPGEVFESIEFATNRVLFAVGDCKDITINNLCIMFAGHHGIGTGSQDGLTVTDCEFGWIGGGIWRYENYSPMGLVRLGNAVQVFGSAVNVTVDNNYIYQCFDTGITHQHMSFEQANIRKENIKYTNNVIEDCVWSFEFINGEENGTYTAVYEGNGLLIENNICRRAGYGFGATRHNGNPATHLRGPGINKYEPGTLVIKNNILDRSIYALVSASAVDDKYLPVMEGNTYIQTLGGDLGNFNTTLLSYDSIADYKIKNIVNDKTAKIYWVSAPTEPEDTAGDKEAEDTGNKELGTDTEKEDNIKETVVGTKFDEYITYRKTLQNTAASLALDKKLNIAYYGGSVTQGYGASDPSNIWRMQTQKWFKENYHDASINEIYACIGESGTYLGSYLLDDYVLAHDPDLVFLEYAINDRYANFSLEESRLQCETIVRTIKKEYPKCDIVMLITIDEGTKGAGWNFKHARAHAEVAEAYNLPIIYMGRALSDHIDANSGTEAWSDYFIDIVHPTDKGYLFYTDVILEYLTNSLLKAEYPKEYLTDDTLPEMLSDHLMDGERKVHYMSEETLELLDKNVWSFDPTLNMNKKVSDRGSVKAKTEDAPSFTYKFVGTELALFGNIVNWTSTQGAPYQISIDGGETTWGYFETHNPSIRITGLEPGEHTVTITIPKDYAQWGTATWYISAAFTRDASKQTVKK